MRELIEPSLIRATVQNLNKEALVKLKAALDAHLFGRPGSLPEGATFQEQGSSPDAGFPSQGRRRRSVSWRTSSIFLFLKYSHLPRTRISPASAVHIHRSTNRHQRSG